MGFYFILCVGDSMQTPKPGMCPKVPDGYLGTCVEECSADNHCTGDQKCCFNGCGHSCVNGMLFRTIVLLKVHSLS